MLCGMCVLYVELFGCCGEREQQRPQSLCVCVFTLSTTARTVHRSSFSFFGEETLYYRGSIQKYDAGVKYSIDVGKPGCGQTQR